MTTRKSLLAACIASATLLPLPAAAADVAGAWKVDGSIGEFPVDLVCTLEETDKKLTGACKGTDIGELALKGENNGATVTWSYDVNYQGQQLTIVYTGTIESATTMKGSISVSGNPSGSFTAKKQ